jgi:hypothetical protein
MNRPTIPPLLPLEEAPPLLVVRWLLEFALPIENTEDEMDEMEVRPAGTEDEAVDERGIG